MNAALDPAADLQHEVMRALFELSPLGLQLIDVKRRSTLAVNDALVAITGYSRAELMHEDGRHRFPPESQALRDQWFVDAFTRGRFGPSEVEYLHRAGHRIHLAVSGVRVTDPRNEEFLWLSVQDLTAQRAVERELRAAASEDRLTGLANRASLMQALQAVQAVQATSAATAAAATPGYALLFLDFDRFKLVNDTLGHEAGDELLRAIARRLRQVADRAVAPAAAAAHARWTVARFGGDEFVILLPQVGDQTEACAAADALLQALAAPYWIKQQEVHSTASIGIALGRAGEGNASELLRDADTAMYEAKRSGRGRYALFDDTMRARLTRAVRIETELRYAVVRRQLSLVYEPIVDLDTGALAACEAKLRWLHPELGEVAAAEFLPLAEESHHIVELGTWMLRHACLHWAAWQQQDAQRAPPLLTLNLSAAHLGRGAQLLETVREALASAAMPPQALQLELNESLVMRYPTLVREQMQALGSLGVSLALDCFGTGSSSLGALRDFPFQTVKLDRSTIAGLVRDPNLLAVAHATIGVIENLGMASLAEGVADAGEVATLQALGCRLGQGPHFGSAVGPEAVLEAFVPPRATGPQAGVMPVSRAR